MIRFRSIPAIIFFGAFLPAPAWAHLVNSGLGPFYDGIAHWFMSPTDVLIVLAMALCAGLCGRSHSRMALFLLPCAWLVGAVAGALFGSVGGLAVVNAFLLILVGGLVAAGQRLPHGVVAVLALAAGLVHGYWNGLTLAKGISARLTLVGIIATVFVVFAIVVGQVVSLRKDWARIVVRVGGSWIGAAGLLMLGWMARSP